MVEPLIEAKNITKVYKRGSETVYALKNVSLQVMPNELVMIMGPSGSGKSTMLNLLGGLDTPTEGAIIFQGEDITTWDEKRTTEYRRLHVGYIFQSWELINNLTAIENIEVPLYPTKLPTDEIRARAMRLLRQVDLYERERHFPTQLSGGEQQRVGIARALITEPNLLLADEPTGNLDSETGDIIMRMLKKLTRGGTGTVVATHDESLRRYADRVVRFLDGEIVV